MRRSILLAPVLLLGACASVTSPQQAAAFNDFELCYAAYSPRWGPRSKVAINAEVQQRAVDCSPYAGLIAARMDADARSHAASSAALIRAGAAIAQPPRRSVHCTTTTLGGGASTSCW